MGSSVGLTSSTVLHLTEHSQCVQGRRNCTSSLVGDTICSLQRSFQECCQRQTKLGGRGVGRQCEQTNTKAYHDELRRELKDKLLTTRPRPHGALVVPEVFHTEEAEEACSDQKTSSSTLVLCFSRF